MTRNARKYDLAVAIDICTMNRRLDTYYNIKKLELTILLVEKIINVFSTKKMNKKN